MLAGLTETQRLRLLIANLVLVGLCIVGLGGAALLYPLLTAPPPPPTATLSLTPRPSFTPSNTPTPSLTPTRTRPPRPSQTASATPTATRTGTATATAAPPPGLPTLTPARAAIRADYYHLADWTPEKAGLAAWTVRSAVQTLGGSDPLAGARAFRFPVLAWREALLRFPAAPQVGLWRWALAYDLTQNNNPQAGDEYATLIAGALNSGETDIPRLYGWFGRSEPRLSLFMTAIDPPPGDLAAYVVELRGAGGSAFLWLRQSPAAFRAANLYTRFDSLHPLKANWVVADLDNLPGDGDEVAIYFTNPPDRFWIDPPVAFNLSRDAAQSLPFYPQSAIYNLGIEFTNRWTVRATPSGQNELVFQATVFPACPVAVEMAYRWNGEAFTEVGRSFALASEAPALAYCPAILDHAALTWGPEAAIALMEPLLPAWPPVQDAAGQPLATPYPSDAQDEWKYRLGVYYALLGEQERARDYLNDVSTHPGAYTSRWVLPAQQFLGEYKTPADLYRACVQSTVCDPAWAIRLLVSRLRPEDDAFEALRSAGMNPTASGYFDFDGDGEAERWFAARYRPRQKPEFWITPRTQSGWAALRVDALETNPPELETLPAAYLADEGLSLQPAAFLEQRLAFTLRRVPGSQAPYLVQVPLRKEYPSKFFLPLQALEGELFAGGDPQRIARELGYLQDYPGLLCAPTWTCDSYYYLWGLAAELAGDEDTAVEAYHKLWSDYSRSPFTTLARLKLEGSGPVSTAAPLPSATSSAVTAGPTATGAPTTGATSTTQATPTPTLSPTPTITGTPPTATPSPTPTLTPTPTVSGTPSTATPTLTPTLTPTGTLTPATPTSTLTPTATLTPTP